MKTIITLLRILAIVIGLFGVLQLFREYKHRKASTAVKARVLSVELEPVRDALTNIHYSLQFLKDGRYDTMQHKVTQSYTNKKPLPSIEELKTTVFYLHYIPEDKKQRTPYADRLYINNSEEIDLPWGYSPFTIMFFLFLLTYLLQPRKRSLTTGRS